MAHLQNLSRTLLLPPGSCHRFLEAIRLGQQRQAAMCVCVCVCLGVCVCVSAFLVEGTLFVLL